MERKIKNVTTDILLQKSLISVHIFLFRNLLREIYLRKNIIVNEGKELTPTIN
jgi:hypothetical protein